MKSRGVKSARLFVGDGNLGLWAAVGEVYPEAQEQLCWNHKMLNVMDAVSKKEQSQAKGHLNAMMYADSRPEALKERKKFEQASMVTSKPANEGQLKTGQRRASETGCFNLLPPDQASRFWFSNYVDRI